jgi:ribokinase
MKNIVVVGSINTDMVVRSPQIPKPGETLIGNSFVTTPGGKGANQAVAAARLGGKVTLIGKVGTDAFGNTAIENFKKENIDTRFIYKDANQPSGIAIIIIDDKGENSIVVASGSNGTLSGNDITNAADTIKAAEVVLFQLETPLDTVEAGAKLAKANGKKVMLNPAPAAELSDGLLKHIDIITPNQSEAHTLTGITVSNIEEAALASNALHAKGIDMVIITMGALGAYVSSSSYTGLVNGFNAGTVIDTVAAGDTFCGGLAIALSEGKRIDDAVRFANAAAAISVTRSGAQESVPHRTEVDAFLSK